MPYRPLRELKPELFRDEQFYFFPFEDFEDQESENGSETENHSTSDNTSASRRFSDATSVREDDASSHGNDRLIHVRDEVPLLAMATTSSEDVFVTNSANTNDLALVSMTTHQHDAVVHEVRDEPWSTPGPDAEDSGYMSSLQPLHLDGHSEGDLAMPACSGVKIGNDGRATSHGNEPDPEYFSVMDLRAGAGSESLGPEDMETVGLEGDDIPLVPTFSQ